jgi:hypothetical protein
LDSLKLEALKYLFPRQSTIFSQQFFHHHNKIKLQKKLKNGKIKLKEKFTTLRDEQQKIYVISSIQTTIKFKSIQSSKIFDKDWKMLNNGNEENMNNR